MKDVRDRRDDDDRENTNGDDRKGIVNVTRTHKCIPLILGLALLVSMDSPIPNHDELDTAE